MKAIAKTPIIAALLCALHHIDADMPSTETELYEERFALLLGKWDRIKGIQPLPTKLRERYWHFLMFLAFEMHKIERRETDTDFVLKAAKKYFSKDYHQNAESLLYDCIQRGLLVRNEIGQISFGHLTYQEFLVGRWLASFNSVEFICSIVVKPWWRKSIEFYCSKIVDITSLIECFLLKLSDKDDYSKKEKYSVDILIELSRFSPLTDKSILESLKRKRAY
jgi:predicted NACHT family NTPase